MTLLNFKEGAGKKVVVSVILLILAGVITVVFHWGSLAGGTEQGMALKCRECDYAETFTPEQFQALTDQRNKWYLDKIAQQDPDQAEKLSQLIKDPTQSLDPMSGPQAGRLAIPIWGTPNWPFACPKCEKDAFCSAVKCPKCQEIFFGTNKQGRSVRRCPQCKYNLSAKE